MYLKKMYDSFFPFNIVLEDFGGLHIELKINTQLYISGKYNSTYIKGGTVFT